MTRSTFLKSTMAATGLMGATQTLKAAEGKAREYFEIPKYTLKNPDKQATLEAYLKDAAIPALNRLGISNVGVFLPEKPEATPMVYVVLRYKSLDQFAKSAEATRRYRIAESGRGLPRRTGNGGR